MCKDKFNYFQFPNNIYLVKSENKRMFKENLIRASGTFRSTILTWLYCYWTYWALMGSQLSSYVAALRICLEAFMEWLSLRGVYLLFVTCIRATIAAIRFPAMYGTHPGFAEVSSLRFFCVYAIFVFVFLQHSSRGAVGNPY